jgi:hypothetical protein
MIDQLLEVWMKVQTLDGRLKSGQQPNGETDPARSLKNVNPAAQSFDAPGEIEGAPLQKLGPIIGPDHFARPFEHDGRRERFAKRPEAAPHPQDSAQPWLQMKVAGALPFGQGNKFPKIHEFWSASIKIDFAQSDHLLSVLFFDGADGSHFGGRLADILVFS